jgi:hypothetical protein
MEVSMECHRCEHQKDVQAGKYAKTPFGRTPCAKCELREVSVRTMELHQGRPVFMPGRVEGSDLSYDMTPFQEEVDGADETLPVGVMEELVARLLALPQDLRDVVCWRFTGMEYNEIGRKQNISAAGAEARHERAMEMFPELRELFIVKTAKQKMRKAAGTVK